MLSRAETVPLGAGVTVGFRIGVGTVVGADSDCGAVVGCSAATGGGVAVVAVPQPIAAPISNTSIHKTNSLGRKVSLLKCMISPSTSSLEIV